MPDEYRIYDYGLNGMYAVCFLPRSLPIHS